MRGSRLRETAADWGCRYTPDAPYEVLQTDGMTYRDLMGIHAVEEMVERYANTGRYVHTLARLVERGGGMPIGYSRRLADCISARYPGDAKPSFLDTYDDLYAFGTEEMGEDAALLADLIKLDFVSHAKPKKYPACLARGRRGGIWPVRSAPPWTAAGDSCPTGPLVKERPMWSISSYDVLSQDLNPMCRMVSGCFSCMKKGKRRPFCA